jgi:hypothetical protein
MLVFVNDGNVCEGFMASKRQLAGLPLAPLRDLAAWIHGEKAPAIVIGGVAVALQGRPRTTRDIDILLFLDETRWPAFLRAGNRYGFSGRIPGVLEFARKSRMLLARHKASTIDVDFTCGNLPFERECVMRAMTADVGAFSLPIATPEDLIIMKAVAHRPRDLADVAALLQANPKLDVRRVRRWVREFARALDMPELAADLERLIRLRRRGKS